MKNTVWVSSRKSNLHCGMDYLLFISMNNENYIKLSIADTVIVIMTIMLVIEIYHN